MSDSATIQVPAATASLETVRRFVEQHAREAGLPEAAVEAVKLAVDEACANVVEHAYGGETGHHFRVLFEDDAAAVTVRIRHDGQGFDLAGYKGPVPLAEAARQRRTTPVRPACRIVR